MTSAWHSKLGLYAIVVLGGFEVSAVANVSVQVITIESFLKAKGGLWCLGVG
jgi:hypothetical protein